MSAISELATHSGLDKALDAVCRNHMPAIITRPDDEPVVVMSLSDYNRMQETMYLLGNPANAEHLRASIADADAGKTIRATLDSL